MCPSWNSNSVLLTSFYQRLLFGSFSCVTFLILTCKCSTHIPYGPLAHTIHILYTDTVISSISGVSSVTLAGCTSIIISLTFKGCRLHISSLRVGVCSSTSLGEGIGCPVSCQYHIWILLHTFLLWSSSNSASISVPVLLDRCILSSCSVV